MAIYPGPNLSRRQHKEHVFPYLLRNLTICFPNHVWGIDITYIRLLKGWMYLVAVLDWYSRYVISWVLDQTLEMPFVIEACQRALSMAAPVIWNSDQGSHFTSPHYLQFLQEAQVKISMDSKGRALDNIFTERLWRTVKKEESSSYNCLFSCLDKRFTRTLRERKCGRIRNRTHFLTSFCKGHLSIPMMFLFFPSLAIEHIIATEEGITVLVRLTTKSSDCPECHHCTTRIHSRYQRTLQDLPTSGLPVQLRLQVRRFFCDTASCSRKTFAEAIPEVAARYARKTLRLTDLLTHLGFALGGEQGTHIAEVLKVSCSADTFLRLIRKAQLPTHPTPTHLGVDDWAFRRNVSYGTILVDLQDHHVVDLLPDRSASSLESWLKSHPGVQLISRDRAGDYALGARLGAPDAVQVADRFHVQKNLGEAVERVFHRHREILQQIKEAGSASSTRLVADPLLRPERLGQREQTRTKRMQRYEAVRQLYLQGTSLSEIARRFQMGQMTVQKFAYADSYPETAAYRNSIVILLCL